MTWSVSHCRGCSCRLLKCTIRRRHLWTNSHQKHQIKPNRYRWFCLLWFLKVNFLLILVSLTKAVLYYSTRWAVTLMFLRVFLQNHRPSTRHWGPAWSLLSSPAGSSEFSLKLFMFSCCCWSMKHFRNRNMLKWICQDPSTQLFVNRLLMLI